MGKSQRNPLLPTAGPRRGAVIPDCSTVVYASRRHGYFLEPRVSKLNSEIISPWPSNYDTSTTDGVLLDQFRLTANCCDCALNSKRNQQAAQPSRSRCWVSSIILPNVETLSATGTKSPCATIIQAIKCGDPMKETQRESATAGCREHAWPTPAGEWAAALPPTQRSESQSPIHAERRRASTFDIRKSITERRDAGVILNVTLADKLDIPAPFVLNAVGTSPEFFVGIGSRSRGPG